MLCSSNCYTIPLLQEFQCFSPWLLREDRFVAKLCHWSYQLGEMFKSGDVHRNGTRQKGTILVVSTHLWNTPLNLYQPAISRDSFHNWRCRGIADWVCSIGVWHVTFLDRILSYQPCVNFGYPLVQAWAHGKCATGALCSPLLTVSELHR